MAEDRLRRDYDTVENLSDIIEAREERDSAFADDIDAMDNADMEAIPRDEVEELTWPHPRTKSEEYGREGINTGLMDTPREGEIGFDWQDSAEEMLPTDPDPGEGMGEDNAIELLAHMETADLADSVPSSGLGTGTAVSQAETEELELNGSESESPPRVAVQLETAMDTDSDEEDFRIADRFSAEIDRESALLEFMEMGEAAGEEEDKR
jgi:hypothetical protein